jgi:hypothetical protein
MKAEHHDTAPLFQSAIKTGGVAQALVDFNSMLLMVIRNQGYQGDKAFQRQT